MAGGKKGKKGDGRKGSPASAGESNLRFDRNQRRERECGVNLRNARGEKERRKRKKGGKNRQQTPRTSSEHRGKGETRDYIGYYTQGICV